MGTAGSPTSSYSVSNLIPYAHVTDVDASIAFYQLLGFTPQRVLKEHGNSGRAYWALLRCGGRPSPDLSLGGGGKLMLARSSGPIAADQQAVLFYMYSGDVLGLRQHLIDRGLRDAGAYLGETSPWDGPRSVFAVSQPPHMPAGELRITDPDGYVILVGQLG